MWFISFLLKAIFFNLILLACTWLFITIGVFFEEAGLFDKATLFFSKIENGWNKFRNHSLLNKIIYFLYYCGFPPKSLFSRTKSP